MGRHQSLGFSVPTKMWEIHPLVQDPTCWSYIQARHEECNPQMQDLDCKYVSTCQRIGIPILLNEPLHNPLLLYLYLLTFAFKSILYPYLFNFFHNSHLNQSFVLSSFLLHPYLYYMNLFLNTFTSSLYFLGYSLIIPKHNPQLPSKLITHN